MPLKSTNIWDDVREENAEEDSSVPHAKSRRSSSSVRRGSSPEEDQNESSLSITGSHHANRHGVSMKSLMKSK
ncbi:MAG: hypothetical protein Q7T03_11030 [Deltaproteobacteria bacterium]|nr:hypothetical protein [Deltaproteobacteria bacterium]